MNAPRGHVLLLVMTLLAVGLGAGFLFHSLVDLRIERRAQDDLHQQALWLARTALASGISEGEFETPSGLARVRVLRSGAGARVEVALAGAVAEVPADGGAELYYAPGAGAGTGFGRLEPAQ